MEPLPLSLFFGLVWVLPRKVMDFFACWRGQLGCPQSEVIWKMIPSCLMRYIWRDKLLKLERQGENGGEIKDFLLQYPIPLEGCL